MFRLRAEEGRGSIEDIGLQLYLYFNDSVSFIHSGYFYSASPSLLLLRGASYRDKYDQRDLPHISRLRIGTTRLREIRGALRMTSISAIRDSLSSNGLVLSGSAAICHVSYSHMLYATLAYLVYYSHHQCLGDDDDSHHLRLSSSNHHPLSHHHHHRMWVTITHATTLTPTTR